MGSLTPLPLPLLLLLLVLSTTTPSPPPVCTLDVNNKRVMPLPQPLLLKPGGSRDVRGFVAPDSSGVISLSQNQQIIVACPDSSLRPTGQVKSTASCISGTNFFVNGRAVRFSDLRCRTQPEPSGRRTNGTCGSRGQYQLIQLGFQVGSDFYTLITACFDDRLYNTVYDHFTMVAQIGGKQLRFARPYWFTGGFFSNIPLGHVYNNQTQIETVGRLLRSSRLGSRYINPDNKHFLSKGHLAAKSDFILGAQGYATFLYVNAAPQWCSLNSGNWESIEKDVRRYAGINQLELEIYTGTHGITTLPNVNNVQTDLYLYSRNGKKYIPVPKIFWKIVYNAVTEAAVVFVSVNNPHIPIQNLGSDYTVCTDVCDEISWITLTPKIRNDTDGGFTYCCNYADFKKAVSNAPNLTVVSLLTQQLVTTDEHNIVLLRDSEENVVC